jgi:hypothetical protein
MIFSSSKPYKCFSKNKTHIQKMYIGIKNKGQFKGHQVSVSIQILQLLKGGIDWWGVCCGSFFIWLELH